MAEAASYVADEGSTREEHSMEGVDVIEHEFHRRKEGGRGDEIPDHQVATCEPKISAAGGYTKPPRETKRAEEEGRKHSEHHGIRADSGAESRGCPSQSANPSTTPGQSITSLGDAGVGAEVGHPYNDNIPTSTVYKDHTNDDSDDNSNGSSYNKVRRVDGDTFSDSSQSRSGGSASSISTCLGPGSYTSSAVSGEDDDSESWMRPGPSGVGRMVGVAAGRFGRGGLVGDLSHGNVFGSLGQILSEESSSSTSATLSLQLPFSEDEAAWMDGLGHTFPIGTVGSAGGSGGSGVVGVRCVGENSNSAPFATGHGQQSGILLERLTAETMKVRMLELNEELTHLDQCRRSLEGQLTQERARHEEQLAEVEKRWLEQVEGLKKSQETLELERDGLNTRLKDKKDMYTDLEMSGALARELRRMPEEDLTIKEYVSLKTYDLVAQSKTELERTRRELEKTQEQLLATTESGELQRREDARARRLATVREEGLKVDVEALRERMEEMCGRAREAQRAADENREKARRFDEVEALHRTTTLELDAARALSKNQAEALVEMAEVEKIATRNSQEATQRVAMLEMDKTYLQRELSEAQSKGDRLGREADAASDRLRELERARDNFAAELATVRERSRTEHEERLEAEIGRIREQSARELGEIRNNGREVIERENKTLREARSDALQECTRVRSELTELQRAHEDLVMSMAKSDAAHETALGELRSELRLKGFELSQLGVAHADKCSVYRQAELEIDMLREQIDVHRGEFSALEACTSRETSGLQLLLATERDKVRAYEDLELEVDGAVMRTGRELLSAENELDQHTTTATATTDNNNNNDDDDGNGGDNGDSSGDPGPSTVHPATAAVATGETFGAVAATGEAATRGIISGSGGCLSVGESALAIPVAPHRRLRQSVLLAQKLLRKEGELETARKELVDIEQRSKILEARATRAEGLLSTVEQPTKYMVDSIRDKEGEIESLKSTQGMLVAKVQVLEKACRETGEEKACLEQELSAAKNTHRVDTEARSSNDGDTGAGGTPTEVPLGFPHSDEAVLASRDLSEKLTMHGGGRMTQGGPRWYSYRQPKLIRVPV